MTVRMQEHYADVFDYEYQNFAQLRRSQHMLPQISSSSLSELGSSEETTSGGGEGEVKLQEFQDGYLDRLEM